MHVWTLNKWENYISLDDPNHRKGLRIRIDKGVDPEVQRACKEFADWLRKEYFFPMRIPVYIKNSPHIRAKDGEEAYGIFFRPDDYKVEPFIRVAAGDYQDMLNSWGKDSALAAILTTISHELTHYFQWVNHLQLTLIGEERQAKKYSGYILDEYAEGREHP